MPTVRGLAGPARSELPRIKGSRFLGLAENVHSEAQAMAFIESVRHEFPHATHHCWAWRLGDGRDHYRYSDDGEPSGTAGAPMLRQVDGQGLTDVAVVVVRWYGGTKLGTGGLLRAYGAAARQVLEAAQVVETRVCRAVRLSVAYADHGVIRGVIAAAGLEPTAEDFDARVHVTVSVPIEEADALCVAATERTAGRVRIS